MKKRLLFVCLGNICRSPAAEGMFLHHLSQAGLEHHFQVDSAGTGHWHVGAPADRRMRTAAQRRGITLTSRARQLERADLARFDLILTMDEANLASVRALAQRHSDLDPQAQVEPLVRYCRHFKVNGVPDPYYGGEQGFDQVLDLLDDACTGLLESLLPFNSEDRDVTGQASSGTR
jgi:protein-tyrosine phosphatase